MRISPLHHKFEIKDSELNPFISKLVAHPLYFQKPEKIFEEFRNERLIVDLGCGNGHFLESYLSKHPGMKGIGIDRRFKRLYKTAKKIESYGGCVCFWDVPDFCRSAPSEFFEEVSMQFPDPWPKKKHFKNRMITRELLIEIHRILKKGSSFCFVSDCREYFEFLQEAHSRLKLFQAMQAVEGDLYEGDAPSLFKKKMLERNIPIYSVKLRKI